MILVAVLFFCFATYVFIDKNIVLHNVVLKSILATYFSLTILSFGYFFTLLSGMNFTLFEWLFMIIPMVYLIIHFKKTLNRKINLDAIKKESFFVLLLIFILLSIFSYNYFMSSKRWGDWDAWAIWTLHAKMLGSQTYFTHLFSDTISWTHSDYPLFLSANIAVIWKSIGFNSAFVPACIAYLTALALVLTILTSFLEKKYTFVGLMLFSVMTYSSILFPFVTSQYADSLFALFALIPFVLLQHIPEKKPLKMFVLIGFFTASAAWIKNEGIMFFLIFSFGLIIKYFKKTNVIIHFGLGALLPLFVLILFKIKYAPTSDLMNSSFNDYRNKLIQIENYKVILNYAYTYIIDNCRFLYISLIAILLLHYKFFYSFCFLIIFGLLTAYFFVYITTPYDLMWHLSTSLDRLLHQVTPVLLYSIFMAFAKKTNRFNFISTLKIVQSQKKIMSKIIAVKET